MRKEKTRGEGAYPGKATLWYPTSLSVLKACRGGKSYSLCKGRLSVLPAALQGTAQEQDLCWSAVSASALTYPAAQPQFQQDSLVLTQLTMQNPTVS